MSTNLLELERKARRKSRSTRRRLIDFPEGAELVWLDEREAAALQHCSTSTIRRRTEEGVLPYVRNAAGRRLYLKADVDRLLVEDYGVTD